MNTDYLIDLQMLGMSRIEAILLLDELLDDGEDVLRNYIMAKRGEICISNITQTQSEERSAIVQ